MAGPHNSNGTTFAVGDGASPEVFATVTQIVGHTGPGVEKPIADVTVLGSTARAALPGKKRIRPLQLEGYLSPSGGGVITSNGTTITLAGGAIALVTSIQSISEEAPSTDATTLDTTNKILRGIEGGGVLDCEALLKPDDAGQDSLLDNIDGSSAQAIVITLSDSTTITFSAHVNEYEPRVRVDDAIRLRFRLAVDGAITWPSLATAQASLITSLQAGTLKNYKITVPDTAGTVTFAAYVLGLSVNIALDQPVGLTFTFGIDGVPTFSFQ